MSVQSPVNACAPEPTVYAWRNATVSTMYDCTGQPPRTWRVHDVQGTHEFSSDEYEMRIEFKRKPKPLAVDDRVLLCYGAGTIDAIASTAGKEEYWVRRDADGTHMTYYATEIKRLPEGLVDDED